MLPKILGNLGFNIESFSYKGLQRSKIRWYITNSVVLMFPTLVGSKLYCVSEALRRLNWNTNCCPMKSGVGPRMLIFRKFPSDADIVRLIRWEPVSYVKGFHENKADNIWWFLLIWISSSARVLTLFDEQINSISASQLVASLSLKKP